ncbi:MDR/zinc-dependent alcohol dehydrogenase-like family protein [Coralloluteibacterium thermophilus]|uniref:Zinc-binding dehydrogenase n=1 Tax=Coralloluteibacterium thermophilum TaxID=2707049 RepID=A0ABV9NLV6_9GAMM
MPPSPTAPMRAAVLVEPGRFDLQQVPRPEPGPGQVRIRLEGSGVCASNIPAFEGREWFQYPMPPGDLGHEGWGVVDAVGEGVEDVVVGDRVAALSFRAYAEYDLADADKLARLPAALDGQPFPGEALGCVMNIFRRADIRAGQTVAIVGVGFLGAALTQLAAQAGARVVGISRQASSLALARECGAAETIAMNDHWEIIEQVRQLTGGRFCERVIEATGKPWPLDLAGELTGEGGRLVIAGFHQDGLRQVNVQLWNWRGIDVVNAHERDPRVALDGLRRAVEAVADGRLRLAPLLTHRFPLARITDALNAVKDRPEGFTKCVVLMEEAA